VPIKVRPEQIMRLDTAEADCITMQMKCFNARADIRGVGQESASGFVSFRAIQ